MKDFKGLLATALAVTCFCLMAEDAYIEGTGTQAILTDAKIGTNTKVEVDFLTRCRRHRDAPRSP